jgi:hypothetical protein
LWSAAQKKKRKGNNRGLSQAMKHRPHAPHEQSP